MWTDVITNVGDLVATTSFGSRLETGAGQYQLETCAKLSSEDKASVQAVSVPVLSASQGGNGKLCIAVNKQLMILNKSTEQELVAIVTFDSLIDDIACSEDGSHVVVGDREGKVHVILTATGDQLLSHQLNHFVGCAGNKLFFRAVQFVSESSLLLLTQSGTLHVFEIPDMKNLSNMRHTVIETEGAVWATLTACGDLITGSRKSLTVWRYIESPHGEPSSTHGYCPVRSVDGLDIALKKFAADRHGNFLVCQNEEGYLSLWNANLLVSLSTLESCSIDQFIVKNQPSHHSDDTLSCIIAAITKQNCDGLKELHIYDVPRMQVLYSARLESNVWLASSFLNSEEVFLIEGVMHASSKDDAPHLNVVSLTETNPELRLMRLLQKEQFSDAELLAKMFGLNVQLVCKARVHQLLDLLPTLSCDSPETDELTDQLISCLAEINDSEFVINCSISTSLPTFEGIVKLLDLANSRLINGSLSEDACAMYTSVLDKLEHKLATFQLAYGRNYYSTDYWNKFKSTDIAVEFFELLQLGQMAPAAVIWHRHADELLPKLVASSEQLGSLLAAIPETVVVGDLQCWLARGLLPELLRLPADKSVELVHMLASWIERRALDLEVTSKSGWPANALELCLILSSEMKGVLFQDVTPTEYASHAVCLAVPRSKLHNAATLSSSDPLVRLCLLVEDLHHLQNLSSIYNFQLPLESYKSETVKSVAYRMLDQVVAVELISKTIESTIRPYSTANGLNIDDLLASYIEDLASRHGVVGWYVSAAWESKSVEVMKSISSPPYHRRSLMAILTNARFPWTDDIAAVVADALLTDPKDTELKNKCRLAKFQYLLISYDLRRFNIAEASRAEDLAYYMLLQDRPTAVADALEVVEFYNLNQIDIYLFRCRFLAEQGRFEELTVTVRSLPDTLHQELTDRFVKFCCEIISLERDYDVRRRYFLATFEVLRMESANRAIEKTVRDQYAALLPTLENIFALHSEFGEFVSIADYCSVEKRNEIFVKFDAVNSSGVKFTWKKVGNVEKKQPGDNCSDVLNLTTLYRIAELLKISRNEVRLRLSIDFARAGQFTTAVSMLKEMNFSLSTLKSAAAAGCVSATRVLDAVLDICGLMSTCTTSIVSKQLPVELYKIVCAIVTTVDGSVLTSCTAVCRALRLLTELLNQCDDTEEFVTRVPQTSDPYSEWEFDDFVRDDDGGLVLDIKSVAPLGLSFVLSCAGLNNTSINNRPKVELNNRPSDGIVETAAKIGHLLQLNSQTRLYLGYLLETASHIGGYIPVTDLCSMLTSTLKRVFAQHRADFQLALGCLCALSTRTAYDVLKKFAKAVGVQYKKALSIAQVGVEFASMNGDQEASKIASSVVVEAVWGYRLAKLHISFRDAFGAGSEEKMQLIPTFARNLALSAADVVNYCTSLRLETAEAMILYLKCLLLPDNKWEGGDGVRHRQQSSASMATFLKYADEACQHISPKMLVVALEDILEKLDSYDYERIGFVLEHLDTIANESSNETIYTRRLPDVIERDRKLLVYLMEYRRISKPGESELTEAVDAGAARTGRLPFHQLTSDPWSVITAELAADTVDVWIPIATLLGLSADKVYMTALRNIIQTHVDRSVTVGNWNATTVDDKLFDVVFKILSAIKSPANAVQCAVTVAKELPAGAEKVLAWKYCVDVTQRWVESCKQPEKGKALEVMNKCQQALRQITIEQILHQNGLAEPDLLPLANLPAKLIFRLYEHRTIADRIRLGRVADSLPDVHATAEQIAAAGSVDINKIHMALLDRWLPSRRARQQQELTDITMSADDDDGGLNSSMCTPAAAGGTPNYEDEEEIDLMRAIYILERRDESILYLINFALNGSADVHSTPQCQVRAIRSLLLLVDVATIERLSERNDWRERLAALLYSSELKRFRVQSSLETFHTVDKSALARAVCRSRDANAGVVAACLAVDFCRADDQLWAGILQRLLVKNLAVAVRSLPWHGRRIAGAINALVTAALSEEAVDSATVANVYSIILQCPAPIGSAVLSNWMEKLYKLGYLAFAAALTLLIRPSVDLQQAVEVVLSNRSEKILEEMRNFEKEAFVFVAKGYVNELVRSKAAAAAAAASRDAGSKIVGKSSAAGCDANGENREVFMNVSDVDGVY